MITQFDYSLCVLLMDWKLKFCLRNCILGPFWGQNMGPARSVKNGKKGYFHTSHRTPNPAFPKKKFLRAIVSYHTKQTKR